MRSVTGSNGRNAVSNAVSNGTPTQPNPTQPYPTYRTTTTEPKTSSSSLTYVLPTRLSTASASAPDAGPTRATRMMPGGAR